MDEQFIGKYKIDGDILAPMAGYTDVAFRELCRENGAALTVTEMVSVRGLVHESRATETLMRISECESPSCIQLFGNDPDDFARAASKVPSDIIDINMGCPMPKIVKNGDGSALLDDPELAGRIVAALKNVTDRPITVKTRLGRKTGVDCAAELIESVVKAGAAAVAVHGRYAEQLYSGSADLDKVKALGRRFDIPVILNGDISEGGGHVMIGRAAIKNPGVFSGKTLDPFDVARRHIELMLKYFDEHYAVIQTRKFFPYFFGGMTGGKALRARTNTAQNISQILSALDECQL
ncbi:MAG: tRNA-dihydrouridine synthase family protein [Clostridiales bacterium]|nr:tRNA-dihydrouridine synthase family protein [Clostridiales bacterium]